MKNGLLTWKDWSVKPEPPPPSLRNTRKRTSIALSNRWSWPDWNRRNIWPAWRLRKPGSGLLEDKAIKNMVATEFVYNYVKDKRTVGVIREFPERGLVEVAEPIGVIFSLTPDYQPHFDGALQMHHGHQDAECGHFQSASQRLALLLRGGADHV